MYEVHTAGSEWQAWLLIYSLPVLDGILPTTYLQHYAMFVVGIAILLGANISNSDLERAHRLLCDFYKALPELYNSK